MKPEENVDDYCFGAWHNWIVVDWRPNHSSGTGPYDGPSWKAKTLMCTRCKKMIDLPNT